jgi:hypothetical protein
VKHVLLLMSIISAQALSQTEPVLTPEVLKAAELIERKLIKWVPKFTEDGKTVACTTTRSTKDPEIDAIGCDSITQCLSVIEPMVANNDDQTLEGQQTVSNKLDQCTRDLRRVMILKLAEKRVKQT